jgi:hypothetical protein
LDVSAEKGGRGLSLQGRQHLLQAFELRVVTPSDGKARVRVQAQTGHGKVEVSSDGSQSLGELYANQSSSGLNLSGASGRQTARVAANPEGGRSERKADQSRSSAALTSCFNSSRLGSVTLQDRSGAVTSRLG